MYIIFKLNIFQTLSIAFATILYHLAMRLFIGFLYQQKFSNNISWDNWWFNIGEAEIKLYKWINVKGWKKHIPTYNSNLFNIKIQPYEKISMAMCQAELVHETIVVFSFFPIFASVFFGKIEVFVITSIASAIIDFTFVIVQRYNRQRILKIIKLRSNSANKHTTTT